MKKLLLLVAAVATAAPAYADWEYIGKTESQSWYIDRSTMRVNGEFRRAWTMSSNDRADPFGIWSTKIFDEYDCKENRIRTLQATAYRKTMGLGDSEPLNASSQWKYHPPGSAGEEFIRIVCSK